MASVPFNKLTGSTLGEAVRKSIKESRAAAENEPEIPSGITGDADIESEEE